MQRLIYYYTKVVWGVRQVPHTEAPDLIYVFSEGNHYTAARLVFTVHCL